MSTIISFLRSKVKSFLITFVVLASFFFGYQYSSYKNDAEKLEYLEEQFAISEKILERESSIAKAVEERLAALKANERVIERTRLKVVDKPVYNVSCIDEEGLLLIKQYAEGKVE